MISSLYSGVQGIHANSEALGVIGANIANVNTVGYKSGNVTFATILGEALGDGGVKVWSMNKSWAQGAMEYTSSATDLAIIGAGLFVVKDSEGREFYTRAGAFVFDKDGCLVNPDGYKVQGLAIASGTPSGSPTDINVSSINYDPKATSEMRMTMNLDSATAASGTFTNTITVYDSLGTQIPLTLTFTKSVTANEWKVEGSLPSAVASGTGTVLFGGSDTLTLTFGADGKLTDISADIEITLNNLTTGVSATQSINWDVYDESNAVAYNDITQFAGSSGATFQSQNGYATGSITRLHVGEDGTVTGIFSNGKIMALYQIVLAGFPSYQGLTPMGNNLFSASAGSGLPVIGAPKTGGRGVISSMSLEMSNVDLATEFVKMITTQRAYQANAKVITTSNEVLQELINMKR
ncbi:MAG: flagellar hook protein FlgE [Desulfobacteraceae bacterium]|nr:flagellar hook protein FlgE [Desulfobacteraceae bacterium]